MSRLNLLRLSSLCLANNNRIGQNIFLPKRQKLITSSCMHTAGCASIFHKLGSYQYGANKMSMNSSGCRGYSKKGKGTLSHLEEEEVDLSLGEHPEEELGLFMEEKMKASEDPAVRQEQILGQLGAAVEEDRSFLEEYFSWGSSQDEEGHSHSEYNSDDDLEHEIEIMLHIDTHKDSRVLVDALCKMNTFFNNHRESLGQQVAVLLRIGCKGGDILEFYEREPDLVKVNTKRFEEVIDALHFTRFSSFQILQLIDDDIDLMNFDRDHIYNVFSLMRSFAIDHNNINNVVLRCPELLTTSTKTLLTNYHQLKSMFTNKQQGVVINRSPSILVAEPEDTRAIYDYICNVMKLKAQDMLAGRLFDHSLDHIRKRHQFLLRAGVYSTPGKHCTCEHHHGNPSLKLMMDTSDRTFSEDVAGLTFEEYKVFSKMVDAEIKEGRVEEEGGSENNY